MVKILRYVGASREVLGVLSSKAPVFISSVYDVPYPLAALREYFSILEKACSNEMKRFPSAILSPLGSRKMGPCSFFQWKDIPALLSRNGKR